MFVPINFLECQWNSAIGQHSAIIRKSFVHSFIHHTFYKRYTACCTRICQKDIGKFQRLNIMICRTCFTPNEISTSITGKTTGKFAGRRFRRSVDEDIQSPMINSRNLRRVTYFFAIQIIAFSTFTRTVGRKSQTIVFNEICRTTNTSAVNHLIPSSINVRICNKTIKQTIKHIRIATQIVAHIKNKILVS